MANKINNGTEAEIETTFEAMYEQNIDWLTRKAAELARSCSSYSLVDEDDLIQEALIELYRAITRFSEEKMRDQTSPMAYFRLCMFGRMITVMKSHHRMFHLPVNMVDELKALEVAKESDRLAEYFAGANPKYRMEMEAIYNRSWGDGFMTSTPLTVEEYSEIIFDERFESELANSQRRQLKEALGEVLNSAVTPREQDVIRMHFGFGTDTEMSLEKIGEVMGITGNRVRQIEAKALRKMRHPRVGKLLLEFVD